MTYNRKSYSYSSISKEKRCVCCSPNGERKPVSLCRILGVLGLPCSPKIGHGSVAGQISSEIGTERRVSFFMLLCVDSSTCLTCREQHCGYRTWLTWWRRVVFLISFLKGRVVASFFQRCCADDDQCRSHIFWESIVVPEQRKEKQHVKFGGIVLQCR